MSFSNKESSLAQSLHIVENVRNRLLLILARMFQSLSGGKDELVKEDLSEIILNSYILGKRLGVTYQGMDEALLKKAREYVSQKEEVEEYFGDITDFLNYYQTQKKK